MEPVALALLAQRPPPLQLNFMSNPVQFLLAMMEPEVLVEPLKPHSHVTLLVASSPVHMLIQPLLGARKKLATTLHAGKSNHSEPSATIDTTDMFEAKKLESLRPPTVPRSTLGGEPAKEQQPSLFLGKLQVEFCEALAELGLKDFRVRQILETHHEVIDEAHQIRFASTLSSKFPFEPQIEGVVQVDVGEDA